MNTPLRLVLMSGFAVVGIYVSLVIGELIGMTSTFRYLRARQAHGGKGVE